MCKQNNNDKLSNRVKYKLSPKFTWLVNISSPAWSLNYSFIDSKDGLLDIRHPTMTGRQKSNIYIHQIQTFQSKIHRTTTNASLYVPNHTLHTDLKINTAEETAKVLYKRHRSRLSNHPNPLIPVLNSDAVPDDPPRRPKRKWRHDLNL